VTGYTAVISSRLLVLVSRCRRGEEVRGEEEEGPHGEVGASLRRGGAAGEGADGGLRQALRLHACGRPAGGAAPPSAHGGGEDRWVRWISPLCQLYTIESQ